MPSKPSKNEIEISIFGNSYGESIVVHLSDEEWIIIDSFKDPYTKKPIALEYLKCIDVDCAKSVKAVVATHWHDDHICGLSEIVKECKNASFVCSEATKSKEFLQFICSDTELNESRPGIQELGKILDELKIRKASIVRAIENRLLLNNSHFKIFALSPSDCAITLAHKEIAALLPNELQPRRGIPNIQPNFTGVVLLILVAGQAILLGADLMESGDDKIGWSRILISPGRPNEKSKAFKIPHHGSVTSHHDGVWVSLLEPKPSSFLSSFVRGACILPEKKDMKRILKYTDQVWITTNPFIKKKANKRDRTVEKTIKETVKSIRSISEVGQIRLRLDCAVLGKFWKTELIGSATDLANCL